MKKKNKYNRKTVKTVIKKETVSDLDELDLEYMMRNIDYLDYNDDFAPIEQEPTPDEIFKDIIKK